jgi:UDP-N-acetylglucosamine/UDP-N-acetylgalactosamine diphosphorylase
LDGPELDPFQFEDGVANGRKDPFHQTVSPLCYDHLDPAIFLLLAKDELALSPNGHGGSIKALHDSGTLHWLKDEGVDTLSYFQVDNVLVKIGDPVFIGHHVLARSQISTKVCRKRDWREKVGVLGRRDGRRCVIEYSDLPESLAQETDAQGALKWWAGSIAIHILDAGFIRQLNQGGFQLPYHKAEKAVPCIGADGNPVDLKPGEKNAVKFETFIFDALPCAERTVVMETPRQEDFSPVKNAKGEDSPETAQRDMMELYARWLAAAGVKVPRKKADGDSTADREGRRHRRAPRRRTVEPIRARQVRRAVPRHDAARPRDPRSR